ncbi:KilA-N domain-containing protein [Dysgonomonas sp. Marseille-P4677]|uniref:KilA-N domain-containing protein n=1 Tax=Dysgonomonas sp. Marseille-P4677 TaxID=2364790 RepID=UPI00191302F1|nr:KilA-N domain-containing protein [Dysgonomonas sp. Marseille-P4677]MBK5722383.1 KilA-N domain-containing protein [Dysgonomonas sp. Marseille-P4677]
MAKLDKKNEITSLNSKKNELLKHLNPEKDGTSSLNGLWEYAGKPENKDPRQWSRLPETESFIGSVCRFLNVEKSHIIKSKRGKGGGTRGVQQIVLEYAKYLDTDLSVLVNEVFFQRVEEEKNPDLIGERYINAYRKRGKSDKWIKARLDGKIKRKEFTACLANHGVESPLGFKKCTNAIYEPLYGEGGTSLIREKKNLPDTAKIRDNMSELELSAVDFAETLARHNIEGKEIKGEKRCEAECYNSSRIVAKAIVDSRKQSGIF